MRIATALVLGALGLALGGCSTYDTYGYAYPSYSTYSYSYPAYTYSAPYAYVSPGTYYYYRR
jgi:hypothetical protein